MSILPQCFLVLTVLHHLISVAADDIPEGQCPVAPNAPGCKFDCSAKVVDLLCVGTADWKVVRDDINNLTSGGQFVDVYFWNMNEDSVVIEASVATRFIAFYPYPLY